MSKRKGKLRQVVDWSAAVWAGVVSGMVFLLANVIINAAITGSPWIIFRLFATIIMGPEVLPPPAGFDLKIFAIAHLIHVPLSIGFACLIAYVLHRWGIIVGIIGGAIFGLALYLINFYTLTYFFPWFFPLRSWMMMLSHVIYGATAGGVYEALEVEEFVPLEQE